MSKDFVQEIVGLVQEQAGIDDRTRTTIEQAIRHRYGGERVNIRPTPPVDFQQAISTIDSKLRQGQPIINIARETGVHRMTIYRWLKKSRNERRNCGTT